ncbi:MAG: ATP-binding protein [Phormidesmis sp.]
MAAPQKPSEPPADIPIAATTTALEQQEVELVCQFLPQPRISSLTGAQFKLAKLLEQIRGVLISLLSNELRTPLCTIQTTIETLSEGDTIPAQAQRSMIQLSLTELNRLALLVESFLSYANQVWALTLDFAQFRPSRTAATYLNSMFAALPNTFSRDQSWLKDARKRLRPFLAALCDEGSGRDELIWAEERILLEDEWRQALAIINHELRTPFTTLKVCLETLESEGASPASVRLALLTVAEDDLKRLETLSRDLELLSRLDARQICFQTELIDLTATLQTTLNSVLQQASSETPVDVKIENSEQIPLVWADGAHLIEVLQRLLENAFRFTAAAGFINVKHQVFGLQAKEQEDEIATLKIDISDSGHGIEQEHLACIFECFYQEEDYLRRNHGGIGIGLTICRYLVEGMGGRIWAESPGRNLGSRFCLMLPIQRQKRQMARA